MTILRTRWSEYIDQQHRYPRGVVGQLIGERMRRQHAPETNWSIELLNIAPTDHLLEIGFGAGRGLALALNRAQMGRVTGMDLSQVMLRAAARRNHRALAGGRLRLLRGDLAALPFKEARFHKILTIHTFYFWPDAQKICSALAALLASGGRLVATFSTGRQQADGTWERWPVHELADTVIEQFERDQTITATRLAGPESRQYNAVAIVVDKNG